MNNLVNLLSRYRQILFLFFIGLVLIIYISLGFLYLQQGTVQRELEKNISKLSIILVNPLISDDQLQTEYDDVIQKLAPISSSQAIEMLVTLAKESGINTDKDAPKLKIPPASIGTATLGGNTYRLITFSNISVQGDYDSILAFISALDSGNPIETLVLTRVNTAEIEVAVTGEEGNRRAEFQSVISAVTEMMEANALATIPNPMSYNRGIATSFMGDNISTGSVVEGFPDITTSATAKGYNGNGSPRDGYVLYGHDIISSEDATQYVTVNYFSSLTTKYYYTCEVNGTVRQWDGTDVATATEFLSSQNFNIALSATLGVNIYSGE